MSHARQSLTCPQCEADLSPYQGPSERSLSFCLECRFPLLLIAGKYRITKVLAEGGFGMVYKAEHVDLDRDAERVVKVIKPEIMSMEGMEKRFRREVQITASISQRNDHIVRVYDDFGEVPNLGYFYVMEFLQGRSLDQFLQDPDDLPPLHWCLKVFEQLCEAIQVAHEEGVVHRDLKPQNILLIKRRKNPHFVKVLDFGIAKPMGNEGQQVTQLTQGVLGSPHYMAPEQCGVGEIGPYTDIYAMGAILYEMLTGYPPLFDEGITSPPQVMMLHLSKPPIPMRTRKPDLQIPTQLEEIIMKALNKRPSERFPSVEAMWSAIERVRERLPADASKAKPAEAFAPTHDMLDAAALSSGQAPIEGNASDPDATAQWSGAKDPTRERKVPLPTPTGTQPSPAQASPHGSTIAKDASPSLVSEELTSLDEQKVASSPSRRLVWSLLLSCLLLVVVAGVLYRSLSVRSTADNRNLHRRIPTQKSQAIPRRSPQYAHNREAPPRHRRQDDDAGVIPSPHPPQRRVVVSPKKTALVHHKRRPPRLRKRRPRRVRHKARRIRARICPIGWRWIEVRPALRRNADISASGGKVRRKRRGFCVSPSTRRVMIMQPPFANCIFRPPKKLRIRIYLRRDSEDSPAQGGPAIGDYCLRR